MERSSRRRRRANAGGDVSFKRWLAGQADRAPLKRRRDVLQADAVQVLLEQYLPQV